MINSEKIASELGITVEDFQMLLIDYFEQVHQLLLLLQQSLASLDIPSIVLHSHNLKGLSANMGIESVREYSFRLEMAAKNSDYTSLNDLLREIESVIDTEKNSTQ